MSQQRSSRQIQLVWTALGCLLVATWLMACGKNKSEEFPASAPAATPAAAANSGSSPAPAPSQANVVDSQKAFAEAEAAMKAKQYDKAVEAALALQQQRQLSEAQAQAVRNQMIRLQRDLAAGVESGDPKAKAAADRLRQAAAHK